MKTLFACLFLSVLTFGQGHPLGVGSSGSGLPAGVTGLASGANQIPATPTAGTTYWLNDRSANYTQSVAVAISANNVNILCSPGVVIQFTGATDGFQISGTNDRIEGCTLDHNSQSGAGTGPLAKITAGSVDLTNIHLQNTGLTNTTSATIFITGGAKHRLRDIYFDGTQADSGILLAPPTSGTLTDVLIDHVVMNAFNPGASAFQAIYAWDGFNSATGVTISHVTVKNCLLYVQGSNAWGIAKTIGIDAAGHGASNDFNYSDNRVVYKAAFNHAYHWFGNYHDTYHHNIADTAGFSSGFIFDFGDTYYSDIDGNIGLNGANAGNTFNFVDGARNTISHNVSDGCDSTNQCFRFEAGSGIFSDNVIVENVCDVGSYFAGSTATCYLVTDSSSTAGLNANDNQLIGNHCKGDGTAGQICYKVTNTGTQAVSHTYFTGNFANNMPTGYSIGASVTNTHISDPHFDTVTSHYAATAPAAASITVNDLTGITFAQIATFFGTAGVNLANGSMMFISDSTIANPCATGGTGAMLKRLNAINVCN